ncbi:MAG: glycosyltransferase family 39 protein [Planctomycetes bacterium]|nr:glycosyltransferase family 39 protein [Planctomycetota bacterium]
MANAALKGGRRSGTTAAWGVFLLAFALRVVAGFLLNLRPWGLRGYGFYREMAQNLLSGEGLHFRYYYGLGDAWANRPPLYPIFLAGLETVAGASPVVIILGQSVLGAITAVLAFALGRRAGGPGAGLAAGLLVAIYPYFVVNDTTLVEQPLSACLLAAFALAFLTGAGGARGAAATGVLGGLLSLTREVFVPLFGLALLVRVLGAGGGRGRARLRWAALCALAFAATVTPWLARNAARFGRPGFSFSDGKALWVGNNPHTFSRYPRGSIDASEWEAFSRLPDEVKDRLRRAPDEVAQQAEYRALALDFIREDPTRFMHGGLRKVVALLSPVLTPRGDSWMKDWAYGLSYGPVLVLALFGVFLGRRWLPIGMVAGLTLLALAGVSFIFWGQTRIRAPADVLLIVLAGGVLARLAARPRIAGGEGPVRGPSGPRR